MHRRPPLPAAAIAQTTHTPLVAVGCPAVPQSGSGNGGSNHGYYGATATIAALLWATYRGRYPCCRRHAHGMGNTRHTRLEVCRLEVEEGSVQSLYVWLNLTLSVQGEMWSGVSPWAWMQGASDTGGRA